MEPDKAKRAKNAEDKQPYRPIGVRRVGVNAPYKVRLSVEARRLETLGKKTGMRSRGRDMAT
jgi:hypothetical protein